MTRSARSPAVFVAGSVLVAMLACAGAAAQAPAAGSVRAAVERVYGASDYQREMPDIQAPPSPPPRRQPGEIEAGPGNAVATILLAGGLVIALVLVAMRLFGGGWRWSRTPDETDGAATPGAAHAQRAEVMARLDDADEAAAEDDWARAIHILLLTSIDRLRRQTGQGVPVALTARELLQHMRLAEDARADLAALVGAAELCHFGGRPADRGLYDQVRTHYERLWRVAAGPATA